MDEKSRAHLLYNDAEIRQLHGQSSKPTIMYASMLGAMSKRHLCPHFICHNPTTKEYSKKHKVHFSKFTENVLIYCCINTPHEPSMFQHRQVLLSLNLFPATNYWCCKHTNVLRV